VCVTRVLYTIFEREQYAKREPASLFDFQFPRVISPGADHHRRVLLWYFICHPREDSMLVRSSHRPFISPSSWSFADRHRAVVSPSPIALAVSRWRVLRMCVGVARRPFARFLGSGRALLRYFSKS